MRRLPVGRKLDSCYAEREYLSQNGADTGNLFMSLIYTCEFCGANPFDYMNELQRHAKALTTNPADWMPWNYRQTLDVAMASLETTR